MEPVDDAEAGVARDGGAGKVPPNEDALSLAVSGLAADPGAAVGRSSWCDDETGITRVGSGSEGPDSGSTRPIACVLSASAGSDEAEAPEYSQSNPGSFGSCFSAITARYRQCRACPVIRRVAGVAAL